MPGRASPSGSFQYIGVLVAVVAVIGYVVFGWRFGETDDMIPVVLATVCIGIALGWKLYKRVF